MVYFSISLNTGLDDNWTLGTHHSFNDGYSQDKRKALQGDFVITAKLNINVTIQREFKLRKTKQ